VVSISVGATEIVVVSPRVNSGPSLKVPVSLGAAANDAPNAPIATAAPAPMPAAMSLYRFVFTSTSPDQCCSAVGGKAGGVVVIGGTTAGVSGASGATVSTMDSPVVISDVVTGPGGAGSGCSAPLTLLNVTVSAPMATTAAAPAQAVTTLN
jgi:hypothetical protein